MALNRSRRGRNEANFVARFLPTECSPAQPRVEEWAIRAERTSANEERRDEPHCVMVETQGRPSRQVGVGVSTRENSPFLDHGKRSRFFFKQRSRGTGCSKDSAFPIRRISRLSLLEQLFPRGIDCSRSQMETRQVLSVP